MFHAFWRDGRVWSKRDDIFWGQELVELRFNCQTFPTCGIEYLTIQLVSLLLNIDKTFGWHSDPNSPQQTASNTEDLAQTFLPHAVAPKDPTMPSSAARGDGVGDDPWWQLVTALKTGGRFSHPGGWLQSWGRHATNCQRVPGAGLETQLLLWHIVASCLATRNDNWAAEFGLSGHWPQGTVKPVGVVLDWTSTVIVDYGAGSPNSEARPSQQADPWAAAPAYLRRGGWCFLRSAALPLHGVVIETCSALKCLATSCEFSWYMFERDHGLHFA